MTRNSLFKSGFINIACTLQSGHSARKNVADVTSCSFRLI